MMMIIIMIITRLPDDKEAFAKKYLQTLIWHVGVPAICPTHTHTPQLRYWVWEISLEGWGGSSIVDNAKVRCLSFR